MVKITRRHRRHGKSHRRSHKRTHRKTHRRYRKTYRGGFGPGAGPVGYPLVTGNISTWPGVAGNDQGMGNHYGLSKVGIPSGPFDPPISSRGIAEPFSSSFKYGGGRRRYSRHSRRPRRKYKGGSIIPQDLVNLGRSVGHGITSMASKFVGAVNQPVNPMPTQDQGIDTNYKIITARTPNLYNISRNAYNQAAAI